MADTTTGQPAAQPPMLPNGSSPAAGVEPNSAAGVTQADADRQQARTQLQELKADPQWSRRLLDHYNKPGSPERAQFEALIKRIDGQPATPPPPEPTEAERAMAALEPPPTPNDYKLTDFNGRPIELDEENKAIVYGKLLPAAHRLGLSQHDVDGVVFGINKPLTEDQCKAYLRRSWGIHFEERENNLRAALLADPETAELVALAQYPEQLNNNAYLWVRVEESYAAARVNDSY